MLWASAWLCLSSPASASAASFASVPPQIPPAISTLLKPSVYKSVTQDREVMTHGELADSPISLPMKGQPDLKKYSLYAAMLVRQSLAETRKVLTNYPLYSEMISYVDRTDYSPITHILQLEGGIWKFQLRSSVLMEEKGDRQIAFQIVDGHFKGMSGNIYFERFDEKSTLVYLGGSVQGRHWPPTVVIERGAEVVFGFTGRKMRSYIEKQKEPPAGSHNAPLPQPRSHL